jgi:hypothetical protein
MQKNYFQIFINLLEFNNAIKKYGRRRRKTYRRRRVAAQPVCLRRSRTLSNSRQKNLNSK